MKTSSVEPSSMKASSMKASRTDASRTARHHAGRRSRAKDNRGNACNECSPHLSILRILVFSRSVAPACLGAG